MPQENRNRKLTRAALCATFGVVLVIAEQMSGDALGEVLGIVGAQQRFEPLELVQDDQIWVQGADCDGSHRVPEVADEPAAASHQLNRPRLARSLERCKQFVELFRERREAAFLPAGVNSADSRLQGLSQACREWPELGSALSDCDSRRAR